ncbi:hypothetical protein SVAN01_00381 [Stagonosporopsis vannaccii]|nr:hypothetical protein SVAN01_00381 [Stagonosporopsis vannaccii]
MAKKDRFDDVLGNKFSLMNAKSSKLLSTWMGADQGQTTAPTGDVSEPAPDQDADLKQTDFGHDRLGVGSPIPKDIADGTFTRRAPTSNDKLLEQLIGKKRAKAHLAAKQEAERASARQQPAWQEQQTKKKEERVESEDEEEGRAAVIAGRGRGGKGPKGRGNEKVGVASEEPKGDGKSGEQIAKEEEEQEDEDDHVDLKPKKRVKKSRPKPTSYLDELLAERSRKKKSKGKGGDEV